MRTDKSFLPTLIGVCLVLLSPPGLAQSVVDGDTLIVGRLKYRLCGIDAPERNEPGYREATTYLRKLVADKTIRCTPVGQGTPCDGRSKSRSYNRIIAQCFVDLICMSF